MTRQKNLCLDYSMQLGQMLSTVLLTERQPLNTHKRYAVLLHLANDKVGNRHETFDAILRTRIFLQLNANRATIHTASQRIKHLYTSGSETQVKSHDCARNRTFEQGIALLSPRPEKSKVLLEEPPWQVLLVGGGAYAL